MSKITHHIPEEMLRAYAAGELPQPFAVVIAAHVSLCDDCRAAVETEAALGGALLSDMVPAPVSADARDRLFAALDGTPPPAPPQRGSGIFPAPVMEALNGQPPRWKMLGGGIRQQILSADAEGSLRLLYIPRGRAVPEHTHGGLELTLVLQGAFMDEQARFARGDVEVANEDLEHTPIADIGEDCICLAATDAPLRFRGIVPRLAQPFLRI